MTKAIQIHDGHFLKNVTKQGNQKIILVPRNCKIEIGDMVLVERVKINIERESKGAANETHD